MARPEAQIDDHAGAEHPYVEPPIGWDGKTLQEMLHESERLLEETGHYHGLDTLEMKQGDRFEYERVFARLRGALVGARETALHVSASPIVREIGELCFQIYTPEGDCVAVSTGIIVHVHTGSLAIKYMIEQDYEHDRGIQPGDIFCNNDNDLGNVHTTDVHTFVPIFHDGELVAWADGVTHEVDIGGATPGHDQIASTSRYEDGLYATCEKIGEDDEIYQDWKERAQRGVRTPMYWDLDEKCRLAGCLMIRDAVHDIVEDIGPDRFKRFLREGVEEGRRILLERARERLFPGTYRESSFFPIAQEEEAWNPAARFDEITHLPVEVTVDAEGGLELDMEGASPPGTHAFNAAEGSMEGGLWVSLTQCLLHDGKVNDGSYLAIDSNFPPGTIVNPQDHQLSYHTPWATIMPTYNGVWKCLSRGFFARGYREEVVTGYSITGDAIQGGGTLMEMFGSVLPDAFGDYYPVAPFDLSCQGLGASAVADGVDWAYAMWNPESDQGDAEEWELIEMGLMHLGRRVKPDTAGYGKYRGGSGWECLRTVVGSEEADIYKLGRPGVIFDTSGMSGGYPGALGYSVRVHDTDLASRARAGDPYPVADDPPGTLEDRIEGDVARNHRGSYHPRQFENYDLVHYQMGGGPGFGDPLERPVDRVREDVEEGIYTPETVERVYGVVGDLDEDAMAFDVDEEATDERREAIRDRRLEEAAPFDEFWEGERERLVDGELSEPAEAMYEGVLETSEEWAERFKAFWDLPEHFEP